MKMKCNIKVESSEKIKRESKEQRGDKEVKRKGKS